MISWHCTIIWKIFYADDSNDMHSATTIDGTQCNDNLEDSDIPSNSGKLIKFICWLCLHTNAPTGARGHAHTHIYVYVRVCVCVCVFVCVSNSFYSVRFVLFPYCMFQFLLKKKTHYLVVVPVGRI